MASAATELAELAERLESLKRSLEAEAQWTGRLRRLERENRRLRWRARGWRWSTLTLGAVVFVALLGKPEMLDVLARVLAPALGIAR